MGNENPSAGAHARLAAYRIACETGDADAIQAAARAHAEAAETAKTTEPPDDDLLRAAARHIAPLPDQPDEEQILHAEAEMQKALPPGALELPAQWATMSAGELLDQHDESLAWLVEGLLPAGGTSLLLGKPKAGKSSIARILASKVTLGEGWHGRATKVGPALYVALDERRATVREHCRSLVDGAKHGDRDLLRKRLSIAFGPRPPDTAGALRRTLERMDPRPVLVVIDTLMKAVPFEDAYDYGLSGEAMAGLTMLAHSTGAHVMLVHHARKDDEDLATAALGSTRIGADVDVLIHVQHHPDGTRRLRFVGRDGVDADDIDVTFAGLATDGSELD